MNNIPKLKNIKEEDNIKNQIKDRNKNKKN